MLITPKISVIIPVYNVEKYIKQCLDSVINQTYKNLEIIVVNDGTRDNSMKIVEKYLSDKRIKVINKENGGLSSARNVGLKNVTGEYIFFLDSDDYLLDNAFENLIKEICGEDIIFGEFILFTNKKEMIKLENDMFVSNNKVEKGFLFFTNEWEINVWNKLYKTKFIKEKKLNFIEGIINEDQDFGFISLILAEKVKFIKKNTYIYRSMREGSITSTLTKEKENIAYLKIIEKFEKFLKEEINLNNFQKLRIKLRIEYLKLKVYNNKKMYYGIQFKNIETLFLGEIRNLSELERKIVILDFKKLLKFFKIIKISIFNLEYYNYKLLTVKVIRRYIKNRIQIYLSNAINKNILKN